MADRKHDTMLVQERPVFRDVQSLRWIGYRGAATHAFALPAGPWESPTGDGKIKSVCGTTLELARVHGDDVRCKRCVKLSNDMATPKYGKGLSEPQVDLVHTGNEQGTPREAEAKVAAEILEISGDAIKYNAAIVEALREGDKDAAKDMANDLDRRGPAAPVPMGPSLRARKGVNGSVKRSAGQRGEAREDGSAFVPGRDPGTRTLEQWQEAQTGKPGRTTLDEPAGRIRPDAGAVQLVDGKHDRTRVACGAMECEHVIMDIPANRSEAITWRQYAKLSRSQQRKAWARASRVVAEEKRARAYGARVNAARKLLPQRDSVPVANLAPEGSRETVELMRAPGQRDGQVAYGELGTTPKK